MPSAVPPVYDRARWEAAVIGSDLHRNSRIVALLLAHYADARGELPAGVYRAGRLGHLARITPRQARISLVQLHHHRFIRRPAGTAGHAGEHSEAPVSLTLPVPRPQPAGTA
ncbi:hypothetical protein AB0M23_32320 [Streptomyces sp. NPDC052077]|uniref:hypothetical protein n=1 Tax=Streptomyces sp. NPDC052077 TaxID=3154757 RepID=UPI0034333A23